VRKECEKPCWEEGGSVLDYMLITQQSRSVRPSNAAPKGASDRVALWSWC